MNSIYNHIAIFPVLVWTYCTSSAHCQFLFLKMQIHYRNIWEYLQKFKSKLMHVNFYCIAIVVGSKKQKIKLIGKLINLLFYHSKGGVYISIISFEGFQFNWIWEGFQGISCYLLYDVDLLIVCDSVTCPLFLYPGFPISSLMMTSERISENSNWNLIVTFLHWYRVLQRFIFYVVSSKKITAIFRVYVIHDSGSFLLGEWGTVVLLEDNTLGEPLLGSHVRSKISLQNNQSWICVY